MVPDRQKVRTDGRTEWTDGRTDDAKTISLRLCRGITKGYLKSLILGIRNVAVITLDFEQIAITVEKCLQKMNMKWQSDLGLHCFFKLYTGLQIRVCNIFIILYPSDFVGG